MEKFFFYTSNQGRGKTYPILKNENGNVMVYDRETVKPLPQFTDKLLRDKLILEKEQIEQFFAECVEVKVNSIDELCVWLNKYDKLLLEKRKAEDALRVADLNLVKILKEETYKYPDLKKLSYAETKAMGCTDIVYWNSEPVTNPETGNEFFTPEDAKKVFETLKKEHADEIEDEFDDTWTASNYIWENSAHLEDLVWEEENGIWQN